MKTLARKLSVGALATAFVLTSLLGGFGAQAAEKPKLDKIKDITRTSVVLPIKFGDFKKKEVVAKVRIKNLDTGKVETRKIEFKLNRDGRKNVLISDLKSGTDYSFKVKLRKESSKHYTDNSRSRSAETLR